MRFVRRRVNILITHDMGRCYIRIVESLSMLRTRRIDDHRIFTTNPRTELFDNKKLLTQHRNSIVIDDVTDAAANTFVTCHRQWNFEASCDWDLCLWCHETRHVVSGWSTCQRKMLMLWQIILYTKKPLLISTNKNSKTRTSKTVCCAEQMSLSYQTEMLIRNPTKSTQQASGSLPGDRTCKADLGVIAVITSGSNFRNLQM